MKQNGGLTGLPPAGFEPQFSSISFLGSATAVLRAQGLRCDLTDVAGTSGYAFVVNTDSAVTAAGPIGFDWTVLQEGIQALGIETEVVVLHRRGGSDDRQILRELFERAKSEVDCGRCCLVWGVGGGQFGVVFGYRDNAYEALVLPSPGSGILDGPGQGASVSRVAVRYDSLDAGDRWAAVFFGERVAAEPLHASRQAVARGVGLLKGAHPCFEPGYAQGAKAFTSWAAAIDSGRADKFGSSHNARCWAETQSHAQRFCLRLAQREPGVSQHLQQAASQFGQAAERLGWIAAADVSGAGPAEEKAAACEAAARLRECARLDELAALALAQALAAF